MDSLIVFWFAAWALIVASGKATLSIEGMPDWNAAGTRVSSVVLGPRPSRARTAAPSAAVPMS